MTQPNEQLKDKPYWSHDCLSVDDNYGFQLVKKGNKCPFCELHESDYEGDS